MTTLTGIYYNTMITLCSENKQLTIKRSFATGMRLITVFILPLILFVSCLKTEKAYYSDGRPKFIIPKDSQGRIDGEAKWWHENGSLMLTAEYKNGQLNGKLNRYFDNGNKQTEDYYLQGKLNGMSQEMDLSGKVMS